MTTILRSRVARGAAATFLLIGGLAASAWAEEDAQTPLGPGAAPAAPSIASLEAEAAEARQRAETARRDAKSRAERLAANEAKLGRLGVSIVARERRLKEARAALAQRLRFVTAAEVRLAASRKRTARLAAAAQRAAREPIPSILAHPDRPLAAARSAMLMRRLAEALQRQRELERQDAARRRDAVAAARQAETAIVSDLEAARAEEAEVRRIRDLLARERADALAEAKRAGAAAARLAEQAGSLRALAEAALSAREEAARRNEGRKRAERAALARALARAGAGATVGQEVAERAPAAPNDAASQAPGAGDAPAHPSAGPAPPKTGPGRYRDLAQSKKLAPPEEGTALAFSKARGRLYWPAAGDVRRPAGRRATSVTLATEPHARVIAPWSGVVVFADVFQSQGVVMIEPQKNYSILLAGLATIDVAPGQRLVAGEPIGKMGGPAPNGSGLAGQEQAGDAPQAKRLDIEITKDRKLLDPAPWFRPATERISGL